MFAVSLEVGSRHKGVCRVRLSAKKYFAVSFFLPTVQREIQITFSSSKLIQI
jgi:hypothetical protein